MRQNRIKEWLKKCKHERVVEGRKHRKKGKNEWKERMRYVGFAVAENLYPNNNGMRCI